MKSNRSDTTPWLKTYFTQGIAGIVLIIFIMLGASSCGNIKNLQYVQGTFDTARLSKIQFKEPIIQQGDLLGITLYSDDPVATATMSAQQTNSIKSSTSVAGASDASAASGVPSSFLVSEDGFIRLYKLGMIKVAGLTKKQLADTLIQKYVQFDLLTHPYVEIRFLNYKITLIGEVNRPGTYSFPTEKISVFDAIGMAGDITVYGKRSNVMVIREADGVRQFAQLDLSKPEIFGSPYYYLQQNDMVIVDVARNKAIVNDQITTRNITVAASVLATIAIFINIFR